MCFGNVAVCVDCLRGLRQSVAYAVLRYDLAVRNAIQLEIPRMVLEFHLVTLRPFLASPLPLRLRHSVSLCSHCLCG